MTQLLADRDHPAWATLESVVRAVFLAEYGAQVQAFPNRLIATLDDHGQPQAVAGLRFAEDGLFSEAYLDDAAERVLGQALGRSVRREQIVEFSSLAALRAGAAMPLVGAAIRLCLGAGANFGMFTATARLRALLRRTGLVIVDLGPANPERLDNASAWGSYYLHDPRVLVVTGESLPNALAPAAIPQERLHA